MRRGTGFAGCLVLATLAFACGPPAPPARTLKVFAAASLGEAFRRIGTAFEAAHPGTRVSFNFAGTSLLAAQIDQGAPADVFAAADEAHMNDLVRRGLIDKGSVRVFARNHLVIVVPTGNPKRVSGLADLARPGLVVALADPSVPAGAYARQALARAGVAPPGAAGEPDVKAVAARVASGEADAGIVYATDAAGLQAVPIPKAQNVTASYTVGVVRGAPHRALALSFEETVVGPGWAELSALGFDGP